ncbi:phage tail assembly protein [Rhodopseudomonas palustris]|uniref:phage tail assembly protein n=1 Tax=Rhodopseudomonas palustris TaxID=1076 RepID=UPI0021F2993E|nr:phage tail assembly protein [Rhodopseudomonas palustris]UYO55704.1 phage tail assembly protein [Rhodopseudomonas palustris]
MTSNDSVPFSPATITFTPSAPIVHGEKTYPTLTLRRMKVKDRTMADLVNGDNRKMFAIIASMAGVPIQVIEEMDDDDFTRLEEVAQPLLGKSIRDQKARQEAVVANAVKEAISEVAKSATM